MDAERALNRLTKWRAWFAGWQLGTRPKGDPESDAIRDHREVTILLRAEVNALAGLLIDKDVFTAREWTDRLGQEAEDLARVYERRFPGITTDDKGLVYNTAVIQEHGTMAGWLP